MYFSLATEERSKPKQASILYSSLSGEEIFAQWLEKHPKLKFFFFFFFQERNEMRNCQKNTVLEKKEEKILYRVHLI